jgi:two-component system chemotaxis response regulator CheB
LPGPSWSRRLDSICALHVVEVADAMPLVAGKVYIGRGDGDMVVTRRAGALQVMHITAQPEYPWHPSADRLVRSAMQHLPPAQLVGVLMTGMGNDGALAMKELHAGGGRTIAEAEETAVVWGMPGELARAGGASYVLPLPRIAQRLQSLVPRSAARP